LVVYTDSYKHTSVATRQVHAHEQARSEATLQHVTAEMIRGRFVTYGQPAHARMHDGVCEMGSCRKIVARRLDWG
jgi:hypothetical protein